MDRYASSEPGGIIDILHFLVPSAAFRLALTGLSGLAQAHQPERCQPMAPPRLPQTVVYSWWSTPPGHPPGTVPLRYPSGSCTPPYVLGTPSIPSVRQRTPAAVPPVRPAVPTRRPAVHRSIPATFATCEPATWYDVVCHRPLVNPYVTGPITKRIAIGTDGYSPAVACCTPSNINHNWPIRT